MTHAFNNEDPRPASTKSAESGLKHGELYDCSRYTGFPQAQWRAVHRRHHSEEPRSRTFPVERAVHVGGRTCTVVRRVLREGSGCSHRQVKNHASEQSALAKSEKETGRYQSTVFCLVVLLAGGWRRLEYL